MFRRIALTALIAAFAATALVGCASADKAEEPTTPAESTQESAATVEQPTAENPIVIDEEGKRVLVFAEVNRKYVTEPTRHGVVCADGTNADKAIFKAGGNALDFHAALKQLGATPGDNVKKDSPSGTAAEGDAVDITVSWEGQEYAITDLVESTGELGGKALAPKFGGNEEFQGIAKTGCIFCLDSCAAGITSNSAVGWKAFDEKKVEFRGIGDRLPVDGAGVVVTFAL